MNPIESAVAPLKSQAIERAEKEATALVARIATNLAKAGWDLKIVAPSPNGNMPRAEYVRARAKLDLYSSLVTSVDIYRPINQPHTVRLDGKKVALFIDKSKKNAAAQYDAFVTKLVAKIGDVTHAHLTGSHVWGYSVLSVTKPDGLIENWKTQQIVNVSVLGKFFNQWPSRKLR